MTVFKTFLRVLNKCKFVILLYTAMLIFFTGFNMQTSENSTNFTATKPDIFIVNKDEENVLTNSLIEYMEKNSHIVEGNLEEEEIDDALFYREIHYVLYIPENYGEDFLQGKEPNIEIKSIGDYQASYAEMLLNRYIKVASIYRTEVESEQVLVSKIEETLSKQTTIEMTSSVDTNQLSKASFYYNFANYSILAGCVYVICLILSSFKEEKIRKRTIISSMNYKTYNRQLLLSNGLFAIVLWACYVLLSFWLVGNVMFTMYGVIYIVNSFIFTICALTIALLIGNLLHNKNAINGIVNVVALGSCFLCGAFVPMEWLPEFVLKIAHILPSYYYIYTNELLKTIDSFHLESLKPIFINMGILVLFMIGFVILNNILSKKKRKIG